eukprot:CAMPEP_0172495604 /NCGR_PEP_ID=MMETSP1066-20121228/72619_1 /TAXON_ID=671091 /ORGANISM="Coscinodiscus wailesii, Strain CCMP2513" /LENGTH=330 /DNA_ID=CAMNT_0013267383 /DNA_START=53 /DNA_END=1045 /DNA_ORIENTATION=-
MSRELYPELVFDDTIVPSDFDDLDDVDDACEGIYKACKGWGTDESGLINTLGSKTPEERVKIYYRYEELKGKNLARLIRSELSGDFKLAMELFSYPPDIAECKMINMACKGVGTDESLLYPIILGRTNREIEQLKKTFYKVYDKDLTSKIGGETSGKFEKLLFNALQGIEEEYDPEYHTEAKAEEDADAFYEAGQGRWGTDEGEMFKLLCASPPEHLYTINEIYVDKYGFTLWKGIQKELSGTLEDATVYLWEFKMNPAEAAAKQIKKACAGFGMNEEMLSSCIVRYHKILDAVAGAHEALFDKTLHKRVASETRGDYEKFLLQVIDSSS